MTTISNIPNVTGVTRNVTFAGFQEYSVTQKRATVLLAVTGHDKEGNQIKGFGQMVRLPLGQANPNQTAALDFKQWDDKFATQPRDQVIEELIKFVDDNKGFN